MRRWVVALSAFTISLGATTAVVGTATAEEPDPYTVSDGHAAGAMAGIVPARDSNAARPGSGPKRSPNLTYHGGPIRTSTTTVVPIYWGTSWSAGQAKVTWMGTFYGGVGGSGYMNTNTEYTNGSGANVSNSVSYGTALIDNSAAPSRAPSTSTVLAEVAKMVPNPSPNAYYPVYIDQPRGSAGYCAWHSFGSANGVGVPFGFFFNLDNDAGCDPQDSTNKPLGVAALANVSGHELSEMVTDTQLNAWYDSQGYENSDKCAWTFSGTVSFGGTSWKIQGNWSNAAYLANSGYTKGGCIQTS